MEAFKKWVFVWKVSLALYFEGALTASSGRIPHCVCSVMKYWQVARSTLEGSE